MGILTDDYFMFLGPMYQAAWRIGGINQRIYFWVIAKKRTDKANHKALERRHKPS